ISLSLARVLPPGKLRRCSLLPGKNIYPAPHTATGTLLRTKTFGPHKSDRRPGFVESTSSHPLQPHPLCKQGNRITAEVGHATLAPADPDAAGRPDALGKLPQLRTERAFLPIEGLHDIEGLPR